MDGRYQSRIGQRALPAFALISATLTGCDSQPEEVQHIVEPRSTLPILHNLPPDLPTPDTWETGMLMVNNGCLIFRRDGDDFTAWLPPSAAWIEGDAVLMPHDGDRPISGDGMMRVELNRSYRFKGGTGYEPSGEPPPEACPKRNAAFSYVITEPAPPAKVAPVPPS